MPRISCSITTARKNVQQPQSEAQRLRTQNDNCRILALMGRFLTDCAAFISKDMVETLQESGIGEAEAFSLLAASAVGLDVEANPQDKAFYHAYFPHMLHLLDAADYGNDPYYRHIRFPHASRGAWAMRQSAYRPYEAFVMDDFVTLPDGRQIPQIGYFNESFPYPAVFEGGRLWMSVTPNEINTVREAVLKARGRVLTMGLGLGYFAFLASEKADVSSVTVVEKSTAVISLFKTHLLPQFPHREKLRIICADGIEYLKRTDADASFDFAFLDLWHDVSDGLPLYRMLRGMEALHKDAVFSYWIEKTMRCYL